MKPRTKYFLQCITGVLLLLILVVTVVYVLDISSLYILLPLGLIAGFLLRWWMVLSIKTNIISILADEMDPERFYNEVLSHKYPIWHFSYHLNWAYYAGDYQAVINICSKVLQEKNPDRVTDYCLQVLARAYFDLSDLENLKKTCYAYSVFAAGSKKIKDKGYMDYYQYYLDGDYEACLAFCKERDNRKIPKFKRNNLNKVIRYQFYAVTYYKLQDTQNAKKCFEEIVTLGPKLHISVIAQQYLDDIERGTGLPAMQQILPDADYEIPNQKRLQKLKRIRKLLLVLLAVVLILTFCSVYEQVQKDRQLEQANQAYMRKLHIAVDAEYDEYEILSCFDLYKDQSLIQVLCIISSQDQIDIACVVTWDEGVTTEIMEFASDLEIGVPYCVKNLTDSYYIGFALSYDKPEQANYALIEFEYNNKTVYFCVDYIEYKPR